MKKFVLKTHATDLQYDALQYQLFSHYYFCLQDCYVIIFQSVFAPDLDISNFFFKDTPFCPSVFSLYTCSHFSYT